MASLPAGPYLESTADAPFIPASLVPLTESRSSRHGWLLVAVLTLASVSANVDQQILNLLVAPIKRDLGISDTQMSYLMGAAFSVFYALFGIPVARLADRRSRRNLIAAGVGLWSVFTMASATARSYAQLLLFRIGVGVGEATLSAPSVSMIADAFSRERLGRAMSVYSTGIFIGAGLGYIFGGSVVGMVGNRGDITLPVFGSMRAWQSVFVVVGLPGILLAALLLLVREPSRGASAQSGALPLRTLVDYVRTNARTFVSQSLGFACSAAVNFGVGGWLAAFLARTYGWSPARAGLVQGSLTATVGVAGVFAGGWTVDLLARRGIVDAPLRVGMIGAAGMLVSATAYPLMPSAGLAVAWLVLVNFFAAFPWGAASLAAAEIVPGPMRAQGAAVYFFVVSLVSRTLGPTAVALFTDHVFGEAGIRYSLVSVNVIGMSLALAFFAYGLPAYRKTALSVRR